MADAALLHPGLDDIEIGIGGGLLDGGIGGQHEIRRTALRDQLDQQRRAVDANAIGEHGGGRGQHRVILAGGITGYPLSPPLLSPFASIGRTQVPLQVQRFLDHRPLPWVAVYLGG